MVFLSQLDTYMDRGELLGQKTRQKYLIRQEWGGRHFQELSFLQLTLNGMQKYNVEHMKIIHQGFWSRRRDVISDQNMELF